MSSDLQEEDILIRVKEVLNRKKIKLWLEPYCDVTHGVGSNEEQALQILCEKFTEELNIESELCISALRNLQNTALDRLQSNSVFKETGVASLRVKVSGEPPLTVTVKLPLSAATSELTQQVSKEVNIPSERIKLISSGRVLKPPESLVSQGVQNASLLMAVVLAADNAVQEAEKRFKTLENTKRDVQLLANSSNNNDEFYMQIENQAGEAVTLPPLERKALVTAMALHEKGRAALKRTEFSLALVLFLEADKEFSACTSEILQACDNYALLHLDIAWCYLCLRSPTQIPDADRRLGLCEKSFHKSYGPNLERLLAIKGTTGNEMALFMRLHLLQGVVQFHQNNRVRARELLERALSELKGLKVDDNSLCTLMALGFTSAEARLGLRATHGNIEAAEELIQRKREEKDLAKERNRIKMKHERESKKLGLCADGKQYCDPNFLNQLVSMGFDHRQSVEALKLSNNSIAEAITIIQEQPRLLPGCSNSISEESVAQVASLGLEPEAAREALEKIPGLEKAVKSLSSLMQSVNNSDPVTLESASTSAMSFLEEFRKKRKARQEEEEKAFQRVSQDLLGNDLAEDHLDMNLDQEEQFLAEYMSLL